MQRDSTDNSENEGALNQKPMFFIMFGFIFLCVGIVLLFAENGPKINYFKPETPRQAYLRIIGETHTGLRLARLHDFAKNYAFNEDTLRAQKARDVLSRHEQNAWATLTQTLYSLNSTDMQNTKAVAVYKSTWGVWNRQSELPALLQASGAVLISSADLHFAPNAGRSRFAQGDKNTALAGDKVTQPAIVETLDAQEKPNKYEVKNVRLKFAKRPKYPRKARRNGVEAVVVLSLSVDERGNVARTEIVSVEAAKYRNSFVRASKRAARASKFHPKTVGEKAVATSNYLRKYTFTTE